MRHNHLAAVLSQNWLLVQFHVFLFVFTGYLGAFFLYKMQSPLENKGKYVDLYHYSSQPT